MGRKLGRVAATVTAAVGMTVLSAGVLPADDKEKTYAIEEIMKRHTGAKSLLKGVAVQVKEAKWEEAKGGAKLLKAFGESLGKNKPPRGEEKSWKKLTEQYKESTATIYKAVEKKDAKTALDTLGKIGKSCMGCHKQHKPK
ncbi:MAG TPA: hypothetical protein VFG68_04590 [Fimbriiglobus sp.]|nr:hypothetical protein [Fimbriiglobus sp.]